MYYGSQESRDSVLGGSRGWVCEATYIAENFVEHSRHCEGRTFTKDVHQPLCRVVVATVEHHDSATSRHNEVCIVLR